LTEGLILVILGLVGRKTGLGLGHMLETLTLNP